MIKTIVVYILSLLFFLFFLPAVAVAGGLFLDNLFKPAPISCPPYNLIVALIFIFFGAFWMAWSFYSIIIIGQGNPQEAFGKEILPAARKLVIIGPYRHTRNPMGFGWFVIMAGISIYLGCNSVLKVF